MMATWPWEKKGYDKFNVIHACNVNVQYMKLVFVDFKVF